MLLVYFGDDFNFYLYECSKVVNRKQNKHRKINNCMNSLVGTFESSFRDLFLEKGLAGFQKINNTSKKNKQLL